MDDKLKKYYKWYETTYGEVVGLTELEKKADKEQLGWLKKAAPAFSYKYSSIWRHEVLDTLKYYAIPKKTEYICSIFKISRTGNSSYIARSNEKGADKVQFHTTYAFLYSSVDEAGNLKHEFVSACPTFSSADGEYRHRFISLSQYLDVRKQYATIFDK